MTAFREVGHTEAALVLVAAVFAAGPAAGDDWQDRVKTLAREVGPLVAEIRLDLMRTVKVITIEGVLRVPAEQRNPGRINYTIDTGAKYPDTLWTPFLEGARLEAARARLLELAGKRVRVTKASEVDFDREGNVKLDEQGRPEVRSFARGRIEVVQPALEEARA